MAGRHENLGVHRVALADHVHDIEPADLSLVMAMDFAGGKYASDFCDECGCRLARACIQWSDWVLRRTENVSFSDDRCVKRIISIDLFVREEAPLYQAPGGKPFWLVPVSIMRRKTLVNFSLRDEDGNDIPLPGLRLVQHLDESVLRSVALRELQDDLDLEQEDQAFIHDVISGSPEQVEYRMGQLRKKAAPPGITQLQAPNGVFIRMLQRMAYSCTLYVPEIDGEEPEPLHSWQYDHIRMRLPTVGLHPGCWPCPGCWRRSRRACC